MNFSWNPLAFPLRIVSADKEYCRPEWHWVHGGGRSARFNLWLVTRGRGTMKFADGEMPLRSGDCLLLRQWLPNDATHDPNHPLVVPYVVFELLDRRGWAARIPPLSRLPPLHRRIDPPGFFAELLQRCIDAHQAGQTAEAVFWLRASLRELARQDSLPPPTSSHREQMNRIEKLCEEIRLDPARRLRVERLAARMGYSVDHFIRLFRKFKGVTPGEFLVQSRLQAAVQMLRYTSLPVSEIAGQLGYGDVYAFSHQFRQRIGQSPTAYRRRFASV